MRVPKCNSFKGHYFDQNNVCTRCGFNYNEFIDSQTRFATAIEAKFETDQIQEGDLNI